MVSLAKLNLFLFIQSRDSNVRSSRGMSECILASVVPRGGRGVVENINMSQLDDDFTRSVDQSQGETVTMYD